MKINQKKIIGVALGILILGGLGFYLISDSNKSNQELDIKNNSSRTVAENNQPIPQQIKTSDGWQKRCANGNNDQCEIFYETSIVSGQSALRLTQVAVSNNNESIKIGITLPLGVILTNGIGLQIDDGEILQMPFQACNSGGCFGVANLPQNILNDLKAGNIVKVYFFDARQKQVNVETSLAGFTKAFGSL